MLLAMVLLRRLRCDGFLTGDLENKPSLFASLLAACHLDNTGRQATKQQPSDADAVSKCLACADLVMDATGV